MIFRHLAAGLGLVTVVILAGGCPTGTGVPAGDTGNDSVNPGDGANPGDSGGPTSGDGGTANPGDQDFGIQLRTEPRAIQADGADTSRIKIAVREWTQGQDRTSEEPFGEYLEGVRVEVTTSMGVFKDTGDVKYEGRTNGQGEVILGLVGQQPGVATLTVKTGANLDVARTGRVVIASVTLSPADVIINQNEQVFFECTVQGPDNLEQLYYVWTGPGGFKRPGDSTIFYAGNTPSPTARIFKSPTLEWWRFDGKEREAHLEVEAFLRESGLEDISLGTARVPIQINEMKLSCTLGGRVDRGDQHCGVRYGYLIPGVDDAVGYTVSGSNFNDPQVYGDSFSDVVYLDQGGVDVEPGGIFVGLTSGGGNHPCEGSDAELINDYAWRFEGGVFEAWPLFEPPTTE